jgi:hypothetical protein
MADTTPARDRTERRPWGSFTILDEGPGYKVKRIEVLPRRRLSYQRHKHRAEHWMVVQGAARVTLDGLETIVSAGATVDILRLGIVDPPTDARLPVADAAAPCRVVGHDLAVTERVADPGERLDEPF